LSGIAAADSCAFANALQMFGYSLSKSNSSR
jgi:hypothetical protein